MSEFAIIKQYFQEHSHKRHDVIIDSGDDAAVLQPPKDQLLVSTIDMMLEGVHFFPDTPADNIAYKSMAISLSDLAAMGAEPAWVVATLSLPEVDHAWLKNFARGFFELIDQHNMALVGGDLVRGPLSVTTQVTGFVPPGQAITRTGASVGDKIYVTGTIGDARTALELLREKKPVSDALLNRMQRPTPRVKEGMLLRNVASAAIDLSDGLLGDLGHLLKLKSLGANINVNNIPAGEGVEDINFILSSGDDYELCFTVPPEKTSQLTAINCSCIGEITDTGEIRCFDQGEAMSIKSQRLGWQHF